MKNNIFLNDDEQLDDLQLNNLYIIQKKHGFKFGIDAVLLSSIVSSKSNYNILDLCTGGGIIPILLSAKVEYNSITGVEIQEEMVDIARRSVKYNELSSSIKIICDDVKKLRYNPIIKANFYDIITVNPPYFKAGAAILNRESNKSISRHEIKLTLEELFNEIKYLLKNKGILYMVHKTDRLVDIMSIARISGIEPKIIRMVQPYERKASNLVLIKFIKGARRELKVMDPLVVYENNGNFTKEIDEIYQR